MDIGLERDAFLYVSDFMELEDSEDLDDVPTSRPQQQEPRLQSRPAEGQTALQTSGKTAAQGDGHSQLQGEGESQLRTEGDRGGTRDAEGSVVVADVVEDAGVNACRNRSLPVPSGGTRSRNSTGNSRVERGGAIRAW